MTRLPRLELVLVLVLVVAVASPTRAQTTDGSGESPISLERISARHEVVDALARALSGHHAIDPALVRALDDEAIRALCVLARDPSRPLVVRVRALGLLPAARDRLAPLVDAVLAESRSATERELRVQAAFTQGMRARGAPGSLAFVRALLEDPDGHLREVGAHLLFRLHPREAPAIAAAHLEQERDRAVRALLERRLASAAVGR